MVRARRLAGVDAAAGSGAAAPRGGCQRPAGRPHRHVAAPVLRAAVRSAGVGAARLCAARVLGRAPLGLDAGHVQPQVLHHPQHRFLRQQCRTHVGEQAL